MDKEHVKGAADKAKGAIKDTAFRLVDLAFGLHALVAMTLPAAAHFAVGDAKDAMKHAEE